MIQERRTSMETDYNTDNVHNQTSPNENIPKARTDLFSKRGCVTLFLDIPLDTNLSYNRFNTGFIPKNNIKQELGNCNEVRMVKIGKYWNGLRKG